MKVFCFLIIATLSVNAHARNDKHFGGKYNAPTTRQQQTAATATASNINFAQKRSDFNRPNGAKQKVPILLNDQVMKKDGSYRYQYETGNGISGMEQGTGGVGVQGSSSYVSPEGIPIQLSYTADETGYHPVGDHIPKTPEYVLRALEYIRTHPFKVAKAREMRPKLSTEIVPPLRTSVASSRNFNYQASSFSTKHKLISSQRRNDLKRRF